MRNDDQQAPNLPGAPSRDDDDGEEIPRGAMIAVIVIAVLLAVLYLTLGGGHNHFH